MIVPLPSSMTAPAAKSKAAEKKTAASRAPRRVAPNMFRVSAAKKARARVRGLSDDATDATLSLSYPDYSSFTPTIPTMTAAAPTLSPVDLSSTALPSDISQTLAAGSLLPNISTAQQLVLAGTPPGVTPSEYASFISGATGIQVAAGNTPNTPAPSTSQGLNPAYLASLAPAAAAAVTAAARTSGAPAAAQAPSWFTQQSIAAGTPNWIFAAIGGVLVLTLVVGAKKKR